MVRMPPFEELDEYEKELCQSADPADHTALLMRIALKGIGIDPDGDDWYVSGHKMESSDPNLVIEEQKLYYKPVVKKVHTIRGVEGRTFLNGKTSGKLGRAQIMFPSLGSEARMIECATHGWTEATLPDANHDVYCSKCMGGPTASSMGRVTHEDKKPEFMGIDYGTEPSTGAVLNLNWPKLKSIDSRFIKGRGTVKAVEVNERLLGFIKGMREQPSEQAYRFVEIDDENWIITGVEWRGDVKVGSVVSLIVRKPKPVSDLEAQRIRKSVQDDADTASMEELEAAGDIYDELIMQEHSGTDRGEDDEEHEG